MAAMIIDGIEVIISDIDQYLQINDISGSDLSKIWTQIESDYASYEKWICYHNYNEIPFVLLNEIGAVLEDDSIEMRLTADSFICPEVFGVVRVTEGSFDEFADYHCKRNPDWMKSEIIRRNFAYWGIFALLTNNRITDYILLAMGNPIQAEIFGVEASDSVKCKDLIAFAAKYAFDSGKKEVLYMADENTIAHEAAISVGFANTGFYKGYEIKPKHKISGYATWGKNYD